MCVCAVPIVAYISVTIPFVCVLSPGMQICRSALLCSSSLVHTSVLSLQLVALLSELGHLVCVCVCVCVWASERASSQAHYHFNPNSQASSLPVWRDLEWRLLPTRAMYHFQRGVCVSIPASFQQHTSPALACRGSPWYVWHARFDMCVFSETCF